MARWIHYLRVNKPHRKAPEPKARPGSGAAGPDPPGRRSEAGRKGQADVTCHASSQRQESTP